MNLKENEEIVANILRMINIKAYSDVFPNDNRIRVENVVHDFCKNLKLNADSI